MTNLCPKLLLCSLPLIFKALVDPSPFFCLFHLLVQPVSLWLCPGYPQFPGPGGLRLVRINMSNALYQESAQKKTPMSGQNMNEFLSS